MEEEDKELELYFKILRKQNKKFRRMSKKNRNKYLKNISSKKSEKENEKLFEKRRTIKNLKHGIWKKENKEHVNKYAREYRKNNLKEVKDYQKNYQNKRYNEDIEFAIGLRLRNRIRTVIRKFIEEGRLPKAKSYHGINYKEVCNHLINSAPENWKDYHIDHIIPLYSFDLTDEKELKKANHYSNLQWLTEKENLSKGKTRHLTTL